MFIFKLKKEDNTIYNIDQNTYINATKKKEPYVQTIGKETKYYALCPECNNPITIVNLFTDTKVDDTKRIAKTHGRHIKASVKGLAVYDQMAYDNCSIAKPEVFGCTDLQTDKTKINEIVKLIKKYPDVLFDSVKKISGINFSIKDFEKMLLDFISARGYYYRYVTKWNLPYSFMYVQKSINLYGKYFNNKEIGECLRKSEYFVLKNGSIQRKADSGYYEIYLYFTNHRLGDKEKVDKIDMIIEEKYQDTTKTLYTKTMEINKMLFINNISAREKILNIVKDIKEEV